MVRTSRIALALGLIVLAVASSTAAGASGPPVVLTEAGGAGPAPDPRWVARASTYDTACSASLSALQGSLYALGHGDSDASLVLGVNVMCDSGTSQLFAAAQLTSPTGKSHTFDARANGYARGEACCCVALLPRLERLKRLAKGYKSEAPNYAHNSRAELTDCK